jgi:hypothetical protein
MTRSPPRPTINTVWLLFGACAFGFALGLVLLVANSRPAAALDVPKLDVSKIDAAGLVHDAVGAVAEVAPTLPLPEAANGEAETPGSATVTPPKVELPKVALGTVALNQIVPGASDQHALPAVTLPTIDLGSIDPTASGGPSVTLPSVDLGSIDPGLGGALPTIDLPHADLGGVAGGRVDLPSVEIPAPSSLAPVLPRSPVDPDPAPVQLATGDLGGAVRRLQAPTDAPFPLIPATPLAVTTADARASGPEHHARASATNALESTPVSVPYDAVPADAPVSPATSAPGSSSGPGSTRAPTFVFTFAVLLATIALGHQLSRYIALRDQVPHSQFLTVLIERPG